jgi:hypothetical protein
MLTRIKAPKFTSSPSVSAPVVTVAPWNDRARKRPYSSARRTTGSRRQPPAQGRAAGARQAVSLFVSPPTRPGDHTGRTSGGTLRSPHPCEQTRRSSAPPCSQRDGKPPSDETVSLCGPFVALHWSQSAPARAGGQFSRRSRPGSPDTMDEFGGSRCSTSKKAAKKKVLLPGCWSRARNDPRRDLVEATCLLQ